MEGKMKFPSSRRGPLSRTDESGPVRSEARLTRAANAKESNGSARSEVTSI